MLGRLLPLLTILLVAAPLPGCQPSQREGGSDWRVVTESDMVPDEAARRDRALAARDALATSLKGRLMEVISSEGPAAAIEVCAEEAPLIAERVSREHGLTIGRTSFRLRNPRNAPPAWAAPLVADRVDEPAYLSNGESLAALLPIRLQPECLMCHGPEAGVPAAVSEALAHRYPTDEATGFRQGELRGWFWVRVPSPRES